MLTKNLSYDWRKGKPTGLESKGLIRFVVTDIFLIVFINAKEMLTELCQGKDPWYDVRQREISRVWGYVLQDRRCEPT